MVTPFKNSLWCLSLTSFPFFSPHSPQPSNSSSERPCVKVHRDLHLPTVQASHELWVHSNVNGLITSPPLIIYHSCLHLLWFWFRFRTVVFPLHESWRWASLIKSEKLCLKKIFFGWMLIVNILCVAALWSHPKTPHGFPHQAQDWNYFCLRHNYGKLFCISFTLICLLSGLRLNLFY